jgi:hypothetical protein
LLQRVSYIIAWYSLIGSRLILVETLRDSGHILRDVQKVSLCLDSSTVVRRASFSDDATYASEILAPNSKQGSSTTSSLT